MRMVGMELDFIEELRLRSWARKHYVASEQRDLAWHPVILDEMGRKELEILQHSTSVGERA